MSDIYNLLNEAGGWSYSPEYDEKMNHPIPEAKSIVREEFLMIMSKGRVVLDVGASGLMAEALQKVAKEYHGIDIVPNPAIKNFHRLNLDKIQELPKIDGLELIVAGEIIEHVSNAGHLLDLLHKTGALVALTTPNAFSLAGTSFLRRGVEHVNKEHVAWYSYHTLKTLVERHEFKIKRWFWYNGKPIIAEGLIFLLEPKNGKP